MFMFLDPDKWEDASYLLSLANSAHARDVFKIELIDTKTIFNNNEDKKLLDNLLNSINLFEALLIENRRLRIALYNKSEDAAVLDDPKLKLDKSEIAGWSLYVRSVVLAEEILGPNTDNKNLTYEARADIELLTLSLQHATEIATGEMISEKQIKQGEKILKNINARIAMVSETDTVKDIERRQRWTSYALAFGLILLIASVAVMVSVFTAGTATPAALITAGLICSYIGSTTGMLTSGVSLMKKGDLIIKKREVLEPQSGLHRFFVDVEKLGSDKKLNPLSDKGKKAKK